MTSGAPPPAQQSPRYLMSHLRWAGLDDVDMLCDFYHDVRPSEPSTHESMRDWVEHGGAIVLEGDPGEVLAALRWRVAPDGWRVDQVARLPGERGKGYGRWLMTKVEALAIRTNVPTLSMELNSVEALPYYRRLGYRPTHDGEGCMALSKRVGGVWQVKKEST